MALTFKAPTRRAIGALRAPKPAQPTPTTPPGQIEPPAPYMEAKPAPPTREELIYSQALHEQPALQLLVDTLDLVSATTARPLRRLQATDFLQPQTAYTKEDLVSLVSKVSQATYQDAEHFLQLLLQRSELEQTPAGHLYYLAGSTPF